MLALWVQINEHQLLLFFEPWQKQDFLSSVKSQNTGKVASKKSGIKWRGEGVGEGGGGTLHRAKHQEGSYGVLTRTKVGPGQGWC